MKSARAMKPLLFAAVLTACTGTYYPYSSSGPQYAASSTQQVTASQDGSTTTTTTTTYQQSQYDQSAPPVQQELPPPPPPSRCHPRDSEAMCTALTVILDVGDMIAENDDAPCREVARALNRYADAHGSDIETLIRLRDIENPSRLAAWENRHRSETEAIMVAAVNLDARCDNAKLDRALRRIGFTGLIAL